MNGAGVSTRSASQPAADDVLSSKTHHSSANDGKADDALQHAQNHDVLSPSKENHITSPEKAISYAGHLLLNGSSKSHRPDPVPLLTSSFLLAGSSKQQTAGTTAHAHTQHAHGRDRPLRRSSFLGSISEKIVEIANEMQLLPLMDENLRDEYQASQVIASGGEFLDETVLPFVEKEVPLE